MQTVSIRPCGDFRTSYQDDNTIFPTRGSRNALLIGLALAAAVPLFADMYVLSIFILIGIFAIGAIGLNIVMGCTGQISLSHAAFFGLGGFLSAYLSNRGVPVALAIPVSGLISAALGFIVGIPAARIRGLYLAIATFAAQYIIEDFFARSEWLTGGIGGVLAKPYSLFGIEMSTDAAYFYVVLAHLVILAVFASNMLRSRDGRAMVALRDHYLSAEIMGINLTKYRILAFAISTFYAGVAGALMAHYVSFVSAESVNILLSIQFIAMIIIGGMGSVMGSIFGAAFMIVMPEFLETATKILSQAPLIGSIFNIQSINFLREAMIGALIILFVLFEPKGLAYRWRMTKAYWKLYPFSY